jgi:hypothetical protein
MKPGSSDSTALKAQGSERAVPAASTAWMTHAQSPVSAFPPSASTCSGAGAAGLAGYGENGFA